MSLTHTNCEPPVPLQQQIEQIINRCRHHEEMFLVDSKTAANQIVQLIQTTHGYESKATGKFTDTRM